MKDKTGLKQDGKKRTKVSQSEFPSVPLSQPLRIARAIWDNFAGKGGAPHEIAMAIEMSPTSGPWRNLCGASIAYGLTEGGYAADEITLTSLGQRIVAPTEEGDDIVAKVDALLKPRILREFYEKYDKAKFPKDEIGRNVLVGLGLPKERSEKAFDILKENGSYTGIILETKSGPFVALKTPRPRSGGEQEAAATSESETETRIADRDGVQSLLSPEQVRNGDVPRRADSAVLNNKVFITHGKNQKILEQIQKLVTLGQFEPIISTRRESAAKPVPDKVMDDMRECAAAVIHVGSEGVLTDEEGEQQPNINPNVLIEIGAAMALYRKRFILVVEEGVKLPSNLQGLYECRYSGDGLDMDAGMKLLEALNDFK